MAINKGILLVLATAIISGISIFINSFGVKGFDSAVFTFTKNVVVAVLLFAVIFGISKFQSLKELTRKQWLQLSAIGLIGGSIPFLLFFKGLQLTTGATSGFIHKTMFIFIVVLAIVFLKEKLTKWLALGALLLLSGTYIFIRPELTFSLAHLLILGATLFWAVEQLISKHVLKELSGTMVAFGRMFFGSIFILAYLFITGKAPIITSMSLAQYGWIGITAVFLLLYVLTYYNGLKHVKVTTAAAILTLGAPITLLINALTKGTVISLFQASGMFLLLGGVAIIVFMSQKPSMELQYERA